MIHVDELAASISESLYVSLEKVNKCLETQGHRRERRGSSSPTLGQRQRLVEPNQCSTLAQKL
jgi:hypothetical protein